MYVRAEKREETGPHTACSSCCTYTLFCTRGDGAVALKARAQSNLTQAPYREVVHVKQQQKTQTSERPPGERRDSSV